ncbi:MAG TPA: RNA-binding S4 domain-containing protein [Verrucomicrobiae bacterium]|jgi:ribosome-associated heat shock protein Hsp15|nr:RNA-binding S4 domain-containing protein [Verrucomicrobiae bacterium]
MIVRIDKWLWSVRVFKTRPLAANACRHGHVTIDGKPAKPSREVKIGDVIVVQKDDISRRFKVLQLLGTRVGAPKVPEFAEDQTPASELQKPRARVSGLYPVRPKGSGRPTKKERRVIDSLQTMQNP